jgi:hypothetical protein
VIRSRDIICSILYTNYPIQMQVVKSEINLLLYTIIINNNLSYNISTSIYTAFTCPRASENADRVIGYLLVL